VERSTVGKGKFWQKGEMPSGGKGAEAKKKGEKDLEEKGESFLYKGTPCDVL